MWIFAHLVEKYAKLWNAHLKCEYLLIWMRNMQNCEMPKIDISSQVRGHEKLQFFRLSGKAFKMMKIPTSWPQDTWNVNICSFGWEICENCEMPKNNNFSQVRGHENLQFFRLSGKSFKMMKITTRWPQDTWNVNICSFEWEICKAVKCPKLTFSSQVRGHEKLQFFRLSGKAFKVMKITTSLPQDTWNVNICSFGWEICENCELHKNDNFSQVRGHENLQILSTFWKVF